MFLSTSLSASFYGPQHCSSAETPSPPCRSSCDQALSFICVLKHNKDVVSALFSLSCPRKLLVDQPGGLVPCGLTYKGVYAHEPTIKCKHATQTSRPCPGSPAAASHFHMQCSDVNQSKRWNTAEDLTENLLCDMMWTVCFSRAGQRWGSGIVIALPAMK